MEQQDWQAGSHRSRCPRLIRLPLIASRALSTRNKVNDKDATSPCPFRTYARDSLHKVNMLSLKKKKKREKKKEKERNRIGLSARNPSLRGLDVAVDRDRNDRRSIAAHWSYRTAWRKKSLVAMTRAFNPVSRDPLRMASVTRTSQLKRTVNASVYRIHQTEDGKRVKKRSNPTPQPPAWRVAKGRRPLDALRSPRSALAQKCIFQAWYWWTDN